MRPCFGLSRSETPPHECYHCQIVPGLPLGHGLTSFRVLLQPFSLGPGPAGCLEGVDKLISSQVRLPEYYIRPDAFQERCVLRPRDNPLAQRIEAKWWNIEGDVRLEKVSGACLGHGIEPALGGGCCGLCRGCLALPGHPPKYSDLVQGLSSEQRSRN